MTKNKSQKSPQTIPSRPSKGGKTLGESTNPVNRGDRKSQVDTTGSTGPKGPRKK